MKDTPVKDLRTKPTLRAHAFGVMKELSGLVENIEQSEELLCALQANARRHRKRGVSTKDYEVQLKPFLTRQLERLNDTTQTRKQTKLSKRVNETFQTDKWLNI